MGARHSSGPSDVSISPTASSGSTIIAPTSSSYPTHLSAAAALADYEQRRISLLQGLQTQSHYSEAEISLVDHIASLEFEVYRLLAFTTTHGALTNASSISSSGSAKSLLLNSEHSSKASNNNSANATTTSSLLEQQRKAHLASSWPFDIAERLTAIRAYAGFVLICCVFCVRMWVFIHSTTPLDIHVTNV